MHPDFFNLICSNVCHLNQNFKGTELVFSLCSLPTTALHAPPRTFHGCANENEKENCQKLPQPRRKMPKTVFMNFNVDLALPTKLVSD